MAEPTVTPLAILAGARADVSYCPWTSAGAYTATPGQFTHLGALQDIELETEITSQDITADNRRGVLGNFDTEFKAGLKAKLMEQNLRNRSVVMGGQASDAATTTGPTGKTTLGFPGGATTKRYWTVKMVVDDLELQPGYTADATASYDSYEVIFPRAAFKVKASESFSRKGISVLGFELQAFEDSSATPEAQQIYRIRQLK